MNHREPRLLPRESLKTLHLVAMLLLPVLAPADINATGRSRGLSQTRVPGGSAPYLLAIGPPPLRFEELAPPPDLSTQQPAGAPPPAPAIVEHAHDFVPAIIAPETIPDTPLSEKKSETKEPLPSPTKPAPAAIIPDDTRPQVRPEDFLPFFQIPGSGQGPAEVNVVVPVPRGVPPPAPLPPSSATYTQTPR